MPDVASFSETEDLATLDSLNHAIEEVLSSKRWEFDMRRAQMALRGRLTSLVATNSPSALSSFSLVRSSGLEDADLVGDYVTRLLITGSTDYANTAFRISYASAVVGGQASTVSCAAEANETISAAAAELFYAEYVLPDTVRDIVRVTHHEEEITLRQIDPVVEFDELYPRPHVEHGPPEIISVGGLDIPTYTAGGTAESPSLRMVVWPIPDEPYVIDYTYHYRHPELTATTSTLDGVPPAIVDQIVDMAAADMKAYYEKDYDALRLRLISQAKVDLIHSQHGGMYADRKTIGNWDGSAGRSGTRNWSRGRLIGGD